MNPGTGVSVVVPNWNGMAYLPECLSSLRKQTFERFEVIVVDNGSEDGSVEFIKEAHAWVRLIALSENRGFAAACNEGIRAASGKYIALLNNDTVVMPRWIEALRNAVERDGKVGMAASKILLDPETREIDSVGMLIYPDGLARQRGRGEIDRGQFDDSREILFPSGCAAMYRMEMLHEIGLFDEEFFAYCEDADLGLRGRRAGWEAVLAPDSIVWHRYSGTSGKYSSFKAMHVERNRIWVAVKNFPLSWLLMIPFAALLRYLFQLYGGITGSGSTARFREAHSIKNIFFIVIEAHISALKKLPLMLKKRMAIKRVVPEMEFVRLMKRFKISARELALKD